MVARLLCLHCCLLTSLSHFPAQCCANASLGALLRVWPTPEGVITSFHCSLGMDVAGIKRVSGQEIPVPAHLSEVLASHGHLGIRTFPLSLGCSTVTLCPWPHTGLWSLSGVCLVQP